MCHVVSDLVLAKCWTLTDVAPTMAGRPVASPSRVSSPWLAPLPTPVHPLQCMSAPGVASCTAMSEQHQLSSNLMQASSSLSFQRKLSIPTVNVDWQAEHPCNLHMTLTYDADMLVLSASSDLEQVWTGAAQVRLAVSPKPLPQ